MTFVTEKEQTKLSEPELEEDSFWETHKPPTDLIFDDGEPMESDRHRINMNALIRSYSNFMKEREDYFVGGNMFIYYSREQVKNQDFKGPDFFIVLGVDGTKERLSWIVWDEKGRYPDVIIELLSPSTAKKDKGEKKDIYEKTFRTPDYFIYDPFKAKSLQGWHLEGNQKYREIEKNEQGWLWSESLELWVGSWSGKIEEKQADWLRFYDKSGKLVLLPEEAEKQRAEAEKQRAEAEKQRAEAEKQRAERLAARLRELGENIDDLI